jgi:hypothetical protein
MPPFQAPIFLYKPVIRLPLEDPFAAACRSQLDKAGDKPIRFDEDSWDEIPERSTVGMDTESFNNFFVICFKRFSDGKRLAFERSDRAEIDMPWLKKVLRNNTIVTFNGNSYDVPIVTRALAGDEPWQLKELSDQIVKQGVRNWDLGFRPIRLDHVDLMEPNPAVRQGLKMIYARLHGRYIVDLPYDPDAVLTPEQMNFATLYCHNDLDATQTVWEALREPLALREVLGRRYNLDLRSKSDAQVGEAIVLRRVEQMTRRRIDRRPAASATSEFRYSPPGYLSFEDPALTGILTKLAETQFSVDAYGKVLTPPWLANMEVKLGSASYAMGIGGLHSQEAHRALRSDDSNFLLDVDVASHYPSIITTLGLYPEAIGPEFLEIYGALKAERIAAKAAGDRTGADGGRVALNGVFGKLGSSYSALSAPHLMLAITLTGQLSVLMLIERAETAGIPVVSANTDGAVFYCPRGKELDLHFLIKQWEEETGFSVEKTAYEALYSSSVNTYIALRADGGKPKCKGPIADPWSEGDLRGQMSKNPQMTVCSRAVVRLLEHGVPVEETIRRCSDPRAFVTVIKSTNGAMWRGGPLGRVVRYYWSTDGDPILSGDGKRKLPKTDRSRPMMEMTDEIPPDLDYRRYIEEANKWLVDLGAIKNPSLFDLFNKQ